MSRASALRSRRKAAVAGVFALGTRRPAAPEPTRAETEFSPARSVIGPAACLGARSSQPLRTAHEPEDRDDIEMFSVMAHLPAAVIGSWDRARCSTVGQVRPTCQPIYR